MSLALARRGGPDDYRLASLGERRLWPAALPIERIRGPRRLIQLAWFAAGKPALERLMPSADLIHVLLPFAPIPARAPLVYTVHDLMPLKEPGWFPRSIAPRFRITAARIAEQAARVVTDSAAVADEAAAYLGIDRDCIDVVPLAPSSAFRRTLDDADRFSVCQRYGVVPGEFFVTVGAVSIRKNLRSVLAAMTEDVALASRVLLLAGPLGYRAEAVLQDVQRRGLSERVRVTGFVPDGDLPALIGSALALLHPATYEGFGLTPLEAMSVGTPTIVSSGGSLPEVVSDAGLLVPPDDRDAWAEAMVQVATDPGVRRDLVARGTRRASEFSWDRVARETAAVHQRVLSES